MLKQVVYIITTGLWKLNLLTPSLLRSSNLHGSVSFVLWFHTVLSEGLSGILNIRSLRPAPCSSAVSRMLHTFFPRISSLCLRSKRLYPWAHLKNRISAASVPQSFCAIFKTCTPTSKIRFTFDTALLLRSVLSPPKISNPVDVLPVLHRAYTLNGT